MKVCLASQKWIAKGVDFHCPSNLLHFTESLHARNPLIGGWLTSRFGLSCCNTFPQKLPSRCISCRSECSSRRGSNALPGVSSPAPWRAQNDEKDPRQPVHWNLQSQNIELSQFWMQQRIATATACVSCVQVWDGRSIELVHKYCCICWQRAGLQSSCLSLMHEDGQVCKAWPRCVKSMADLSAIGPFLRTLLPDFPGSCADSSTLYILRPAQKEPYFRWL